MEEETLQLIIRHLNGLKTDIINEVRTDINDVNKEPANSLQYVYKSPPKGHILRQLNPVQNQQQGPS
jgi:hypothetical protein